MLNVAQFKKYIVVPALRYIWMYSPSAVNILLGTAAQESQFTYLHQLEDGPALSLYQIEPFTANDIYDNYLKYHPQIRDRINTLAGLSSMDKPMPEYMKAMLISNLRYSTGIARCQYYRRKEPLPDENDIEGMARYWKKYFNTHLGKGTEQEFITNYKEFVEGH